MWGLCSLCSPACFPPFLSLTSSVTMDCCTSNVSLYAGPGVRHVAHLLSPFNSSLPIRLFLPLSLCSRHSSLLGQVPFLLMRWKWAVGIAKWSGADLWRHFYRCTPWKHTQGQAKQGPTHRQWRHGRTQWHRKLRGWPRVIQLDSSWNTRGVRL